MNRVLSCVRVKEKRDAEWATARHAGLYRAGRGAHELTGDDTVTVCSETFFVQVPSTARMTRRACGTAVGAVVRVEDRTGPVTVACSWRGTSSGSGAG